MQASCSLSRPGLLPVLQRQDPGPASGTALLSLDKDQMLQEKDKQIEELTRMLRQKQRLVETLRSQLEQGKRGSAAEVADNMGNAEIPLLSNGLEVRVKEEVKEEMDTSEDLQKQVQPLKKIQTQCSQQTLLKLQQIHRLQVQQQQMLVDLPNVQNAQLLQQQKQHQQIDTQKLQQEQGKTRVLQLQKQQKAQLLQQQKLQLLQQQKVKLLQQQQQKTLLHQQQKTQLQQQKKTALLQQQQQQKLQQLIIQQSQQKQLQTNQKQQQTPQNQQLQTPQVSNISCFCCLHFVFVQFFPSFSRYFYYNFLQVSQVFINQPSGTQITTSFPLDLLKAHSTPTLVTDSNGNRYLIALTSNSVESLTGKSPQSKSNGRITLQVTKF